MKTNPTRQKLSPFIQIVPRFPPDITALNLIEKALIKLDHTGQTSRIPNAFIAYRMAFCKQLQSIQHPIITQPQLSAMAKQSWQAAPEHVRNEYQRIASEARDIFKQIYQSRIQYNLERERENENVWNEPHFNIENYPTESSPIISQQQMSFQDSYETQVSNETSYTNFGCEQSEYHLPIHQSQVEIFNKPSTDPQIGQQDSPYIEPFYPSPISETRSPIRDSLNGNDQLNMNSESFFLPSPRDFHEQSSRINELFSANQTIPVSPMNSTQISHDHENSNSCHLKISFLQNRVSELEKKIEHLSLLVSNKTF
ncbi:hypothetical protein G9A89_004503 [Geosiphon pyriformis]|nr:hypothetical protein G9A89_004503 [Geosiphon pyriformis]